MAANSARIVVGASEGTVSDDSAAYNFSAIILACDAACLPACGGNGIRYAVCDFGIFTIDGGNAGGAGVVIGISRVFHTGISYFTVLDHALVGSADAALSCADAAVHRKVADGTGTDGSVVKTGDWAMRKMQVFTFAISELEVIDFHILHDSFCAK